MRQAVIVGCGLIGLSSAYYLQQRGFHVVVVDRAAAPGRGTSYANGGLLTPSMSDPWNAPGVLGTLLRSIGREDSALLLRWRALPGYLGWGSRFLRNSRPDRFRRNLQANLSLGIQSLADYRQLCDTLNGDHHRMTGGTLRVFRDDAALTAGLEARRVVRQAGLEARHLDVADAVRLEPSLYPIADKMVGAIHYPGDEAGDAHLFCRDLHRYILANGGVFLLETDVTGVLRTGARVRGVRTAAAGSLAADVTVLACGAETPKLAAAAGVRLPVRPVKGYSLTVSRPPAGAPSLPVIDDALHAAVTPLGPDLRIAGTAEFAGTDLSLPRTRIDNLWRLFRETFPVCAARVDPGDATCWAGLRPMSADGVPIISQAAPGLFINTGHGHLGWTLAAGSGRLLADLATRSPSPIDPHPYRLARFL